MRDDNSLASQLNEIIGFHSREADGFSQMAKDILQCEKEKRQVMAVFKGILKKHISGGEVSIESRLGIIIDELYCYKKQYEVECEDDSQGVVEDTLSDIISKLDAAKRRTS